MGISILPWCNTAWRGGETFRPGTNDRTFPPDTRCIRPYSVFCFCFSHLTRTRESEEGRNRARKLFEERLFVFCSEAAERGNQVLSMRPHSSVGRDGRGGISDFDLTNCQREKNRGFAAVISGVWREGQTRRVLDGNSYRPS
ncbi:hypothetical protein Bbelb_137720 [Branchiostoma belcheri]|nr:hypothetical protein Bbelb_137720 [Branchiostoma belcheri]